MVDRIPRFAIFGKKKGPGCTCEMRNPTPDGPEAAGGYGGAVGVLLRRGVREGRVFLDGMLRATSATDYRS